MKRNFNHPKTCAALLKIFLIAFVFLAASPAWSVQKAKSKVSKAAAKTVKAHHPKGSTKTEAGKAQEGVVNINKATAMELCFLPGIGPKKSEKIIRFRQKKPFKSPKDLLKIKGIGRKSLKKLLPYVTVSGETTLKTHVSVM